MADFNAEPFGSLRDEATVLMMSRALRDAKPDEVKARLAPFNNDEVRRLGQIAARREMLRRIALWPPVGGKR